tara:strand:- start:3559 stop:3738 length:180 start_codon:yes stop_codon:yes gene_type:complete
MTGEEEFKLILSDCNEVTVHRSIVAAYLAGRKSMQDEIINKLGDYQAEKCAQIAASIPL